MRKRARWGESCIRSVSDAAPLLSWWGIVCEGRRSANVRHEIQKNALGRGLPPPRMSGLALGEAGMLMDSKNIFNEKKGGVMPKIEVRQGRVGKIIHADELGEMLPGCDGYAIFQPVGQRASRCGLSSCHFTREMLRGAVEEYKFIAEFLATAYEVIYSNGR